jgi:dihydropteroate synthase
MSAVFLFQTGFPFMSWFIDSRSLSTPRVMGILNATPDSFSDGGRYFRQCDALARCRQMIAEGVDVIDIGGESTRPGATPVSDETEMERVVPVIEAIREESDIPISIDTSKPVVMRAAVAAGATLINDVRALREPGALEAAAELKVPVCLMHMQGEPRTMQLAPVYEDVVEDVLDFLQQRVTTCESVGISREHIILDPGFGFGKSLQHNLTLFRDLPQIVATGHPVMVGVSRKSLIGQVLNLPLEDRQAASIALAGLAVWLGASIIRAHDVQATVHAVRMCQAVKTGHA